MLGKPLSSQTLYCKHIQDVFLQLHPSSPCLRVLMETANSVVKEMQRLTPRLVPPLSGNKWSFLSSLMLTIGLSCVELCFLATPCW